MLRRTLLAVSLAIAAGPGLAQQSPLQTVPTPSVKPPSRTTPVLITADQVNYDRARSLVVAKGNVEISQGARVLKADQIVYDQKAKTVTATGNISLKEPSGEIVFAKRLVLKDDLRDGVVQNFRMLFPDDTRVAANSAVRSKGRKTEMREVVFSPCRLCEKDPTRAPLWQLKARRVVHDQVTRDIEYYDAWMEVFGLPVVYTPYFRHPDPTVKRRRGFLTPTYRSDSVLGFSLETPYFVPLGPDKDLTLSPRFFTKVRPALGLEWRHRVKGGAYDIVGTVTNVKRRDASGDRLDGDQTRGYVFTRGLFNLDRKWRAGWSGGWSSDDLFLRRYGINTPRSTFTAAENVITSTAYAEAFKGRNYFSTRGYSFQGLREEDDFNRTPVILPLIDYKSLSTPLGPWGRAVSSLAPGRHAPARSAHSPSRHRRHQEHLHHDDEDQEQHAKPAQARPDDAADLARAGHAHRRGRRGAVACLRLTLHPEVDGERAAHDRDKPVGEAPDDRDDPEDERSDRDARSPAPRLAQRERDGRAAVRAERFDGLPAQVLTARDAREVHAGSRGRGRAGRRYRLDGRRARRIGRAAVGIMRPMGAVSVLGIVRVYAGAPSLRRTPAPWLLQNRARGV